MSGVAFQVPVVKTLPVASPEIYAKYMNRAQNKRRPGAREASVGVGGAGDVQDFWVVHRTAELTLVGDVVVSRAGLGQYVVGLASTLRLSVVDVTFGGGAVTGL